MKHVREEIGREGKEPKEGRVVGGEVNNTRGQVLGLDAEVLEKTEDGDNQLAVNEHFNLLESEFGVAGGAWETADTPGLVESGHNWRDKDVKYNKKMDKS